MSTWYYRQRDQEVGPFDRDALDKLQHAGLIDDTTPVKSSLVSEWQTFGESRAETSSTPVDSGAAAAQYYYLDTNRQPVGPFDFTTLSRLEREGIITAATLTSAKGDAQWVALSKLSRMFRNLDEPVSQMPDLSQDNPSNLPEAGDSRTSTDAVEGVPRYRNLDEFAKMMGLTLTFWTFYLVPSYSRDMKAITGRERIEFTALMILGIVTLGLLIVVMEVLWAYDLERHGKVKCKAGRQESLGTIVLVLNVLGFVLSFAIDGFVLAFIVGGVLGASALWMLQKEINLYATSDEIT